jgi:hypothetical protein
MKTQIVKITEDLENGNVSLAEAQKLLLGLFAVMPSLPKYDTIKDKAFEYAKDQWKNDNCTYQDLKYAEKDFMNGAIWMMKLLRGNEA